MDRRLGRILASLLVLVLAVSLAAGCAQPTTTTTEKPKSSVKAAVVTDVGGLGDKSFNDAAAAGLDKAKKDFSVETKVVESKEQADYETNLTNLANAGFSPIFAVGFLMTDTVAKVAPKFPKIDFGGVDEAFPETNTPANVVGLNFHEQQGCYLAGIVAGLATKDKAIDPRINDKNVVGFVGGLDVPLIKKFEAGFKAGVKSVNPDCQVVTLYAGSFNDQAKGKEVGLTEINQGADIIFAAAGATGIGTYQACKEKKALFVGVDQDQFVTLNDQDTVLTSVVKRVDTAVYDTIKSAVEGKFEGGKSVFFGLKEGGMELAPYHSFESKVPATIKDAVEKAKTGIIDGTITVPTTP